MKKAEGTLLKFLFIKSQFLVIEIKKVLNVQFVLLELLMEILLKD